MPFSQPWPAGGQASFSKGLAERTLSAEAKRNDINISILQEPLFLPGPNSTQNELTYLNMDPTGLIWPPLTVNVLKGSLVMCQANLLVSVTEFLTLGFSFGLVSTPQATLTSTFAPTPTTANPQFQAAFAGYSTYTFAPASRSGFCTFVPACAMQYTWSSTQMGTYVAENPPFTLNDPVMGQLSEGNKLQGSSVTVLAGYFAVWSPPSQIPSSTPFTLDNTPLGELDGIGGLV